MGVFLLFIGDIKNILNSDFIQIKIILPPWAEIKKNSFFDSHPWQRKQETYKTSFFANYEYFQWIFQWETNVPSSEDPWGFFSYFPLHKKEYTERSVDLFFLVGRKGQNTA